MEKDIYNDKIGILDIKATLDNNIICDIEMQMVNQFGLEQRILFYWSKLYTTSMKKAQNYRSLKKTIVILLTNFEQKKIIYHSQRTYSLAIT